MHSKSLLATSLWTATALAFQGTSPFMMMSNSDHQPSLSRHQQIATSEQINGDTLAFLSQCPSDIYVFAHQPQVHADDFAEIGLATSFSQRWAHRPAYNVPEVIGAGMDQEAAIKTLQSKCNAQVVDSRIDEDGSFEQSFQYPQILRLPSAQLSLDNEQARTKDIFDHHSLIDRVMNNLSDRSFTFIYHGTPPPESYFMDQYTLQIASKPSARVVHQDLKRDMSRGSLNKRQDDYPPSAGLFEKYNFFSPAIFMGAVAIILLFSIGSVGVSALAGVKVSYAAFSKEMGPSAQKKQQ